MSTMFNTPDPMGVLVASKRIVSSSFSELIPSSAIGVKDVFLIRATISDINPIAGDWMYLHITDASSIVNFFVHAYFDTDPSNAGRPLQKEGEGPLIMVAGGQMKAKIVFKSGMLPSASIAVWRLPKARYT